MIGGIFNTFPYTSVFAECRPRRRHRHPLALGDRDRWRHHAGARLPAEDGGPGRGGAAGRARRRRPRHVRHGCRHRRAHPHRRRLQDQSLQPVRGRDRGRVRHDPAGGAPTSSRTRRTSFIPCWSRASCSPPSRRSCSTRSSTGSAAPPVRQVGSQDGRG